MKYLKKYKEFYINSQSMDDGDIGSECLWWAELPANNRHEPEINIMGDKWSSNEEQKIENYYNLLHDIDNFWNTFDRKR